MRRAKKEGRWMGTAPIGYANKVNEAGKKYIAPKEKEANLMRWVFEQLATAEFNTEQIWKKAREKGLRCSRNNFWLAVRNPLYCGKILIPKYKDEEAFFVPGQHEPLISETLFYQVQDVINGRKRVIRTKMLVDDHFPLRGFLICPQCGKVLTGSASKGRNQHYHYYHCREGCRFRHRADEVNDQIVEEIRKYVQPLPTLQLYKEIIGQIFRAKTKLQRDEVQQWHTQIEQANTRISKARELLLNGDIEADDYRAIKSESENTINRLEAKLAATYKTANQVEPLLNQAISHLSQLDVLYVNGTTEQKRKIIGSVFPEKLCFDGSHYRTTRINEVVTLISLIDKQIRGQKTGQV